MRKDKLVEISGWKYIAGEVSTASDAIIKSNDARAVDVALVWQQALFLLDDLTNN